MNDILLLYLVTRAGAIGSLFGGLAFIAAVAGAVTLFILALNISDNATEGEGPAAWKFWRKVAAGFVMTTIIFGFLHAAIPSNKDIAIIIGGKIALDAARTETGQEIGAEVLAAVRAQLKAAKE